MTIALTLPNSSDEIDLITGAIIVLRINDIENPGQVEQVPDWSACQAVLWIALRNDWAKDLDMPLVGADRDNIIAEAYEGVHGETKETFARAKNLLAKKLPLLKVWGYDSGPEIRRLSDDVDFDKCEVCEVNDFLFEAGKPHKVLFRNVAFSKAEIINAWPENEASGIVNVLSSIEALSWIINRDEREMALIRQMNPQTPEQIKRLTTDWLVDDIEKAQSELYKKCFSGEVEAFAIVAREHGIDARYNHPISVGREMLAGLEFDLFKAEACQHVSEGTPTNTKELVMWGLEFRRSDIFEQYEAQGSNAEKYMSFKDAVGNIGLPDISHSEESWAVLDELEFCDDIFRDEEVKRLEVPPAQYMPHLRGPIYDVPHMNQQLALEDVYMHLSPEMKDMCSGHRMRLDRLSGLEGGVHDAINQIRNACKTKLSQGGIIATGVCAESGEREFIPLSVWDGVSIYLGKSLIAGTERSRNHRRERKFSDVLLWAQDFKRWAETMEMSSLDSMADEGDLNTGGPRSLAELSNEKAAENDMQDWVFAGSNPHTTATAAKEYLQRTHKISKRAADRVWANNALEEWKKPGRRPSD